MRLSLLLVLLLSTGCGHHARSAPKVGLILADVQPTVTVSPIVVFRIEYLRDWETPYFVTESEIVSLSLPDAIKRGIPPSLWIFCAISYPEGTVVPIRFVKPLRA